MNTQEIKNAVDKGLTVRWANKSYKVIKDKNGEYLIKHTHGHCIGLTWADGETLNGNEEDFYIGSN